MDIRTERIRAELARFLERKTAPRGLGDAALVEEINVLVAAVSGALPRNPSDAVDALRVGLRRLELAARHRGWPSGGELQEACKARTAAASSVGDEERKARHIEIARDGWAKWGDLPGWLCYEHVFRALIADGIPARTLWHAGVDLPRHMRDWPEAAHWRGTPAHARVNRMPQVHA